MNVRELFKLGMTVPEHETRDLHYIGEALPVPSQIVSTLEVGISPYTGDSPIVAREDHVHDIDTASLITLINDNAGDVENFYTTTEIDNIINNLIIGDIGDIYYTEAEIDTFLDAITVILTDFEDRITALEDAIAGIDFTQFLSFELGASYGLPTVNPPSTSTLIRYDAFRAFKITEVSVTLVLDSSTDYVVKLWQQFSGTGGYSVVNTTTITAGDLIENDVLTTPLDVGVNDQLLITLDTESSGDGEILCAYIRGFYVT